MLGNVISENRMHGSPIAGTDEGRDTFSIALTGPKLSVLLTLALALGPRAVLLLPVPLALARLPSAVLPLPSPLALANSPVATLPKVLLPLALAPYP